MIGALLALALSVGVDVAQAIPPRLEIPRGEVPRDVDPSPDPPPKEKP